MKPVCICSLFSLSLFFFSQLWIIPCFPFLNNLVVVIFHSRCLSGKESAFSARNVGWISGLGRSPGRENGNLLQYSCLKIRMDRGA